MHKISRGGININSMAKSKIILGAGVDATFNAKIKAAAQKVKENVYNIAKQTNCEPQKLLDYIKAAKTPVYKLNNADKFLAIIKETEGLICEQRGFNALYLSIITGNGIQFKTEPMFVMREGAVDKYTLLHHFYRWYALKSDLPGFDYKVQQKFKKYLIDNSDEATKKLTIEDIADIKEAIARDKEATIFVLEYTKEVEGSKNVMNKIKTDGSANI